MLLDKHPLFGFGPRTFEQIFPLFDVMPVRGVGSWHNDYLQVYMESGLVGLSAMLWLVVAVYRQAWRFLRCQPSDPDRHLVLGLLFALTVVFLVGGVLDTLVGILFRVLLAMFAIVTVQLGRVKSADVNES